MRPGLLECYGMAGMRQPKIHLDAGFSILAERHKIFQPSVVQSKHGLESQQELLLSGDHVSTMSALSRHQVEILHKCLTDNGITELMEIAGRTDRTKFRNQVLNPLIDAGLLEMTVPDKPSSSKQKYRTTEKGRTLLKKQTKEAGADG